MKQSRPVIRQPYCIRMRPLLLFAIGAALLAQSPKQTKNPPTPPAGAVDPDQPIRVDVDVVSILASVRDKKGALVPTLEKNEFSVLEDGKPQEIKYFTRETDLPLTIGLLVDVSGSQRNLIDVERNAASQFFAQVLRKKDEAFLIQFGEEAELLQDYTSSTKLLTNGLGQLRPSSGVGGLHPGPVPTMGGPRGTVLYDAIYLAANDKLRTEVGRKVIVVITDGVDQGSRLTLNQAVEAAQKSDAVIYSIDYSDPGAYGGGYGIMFGGGGGESYLRKMSDETGGHVFKVDRKHSLDDIFKQLQEEMRTQYAIGYAPQNDTKDGSYRKIDIKLLGKDYKDYKVQARKGYYAVKPESR